MRIQNILGSSVKDKSYSLAKDEPFCSILIDCSLLLEMNVKPLHHSATVDVVSVIGGLCSMQV